MEGKVEMAYFTFPGYEGRGIGTAMARFVLDRARLLPDVKWITATPRPNTTPPHGSWKRSACGLRARKRRTVFPCGCGRRRRATSSSYGSIRGSTGSPPAGTWQKLQEFLVLVGCVVLELGVQAAHILFGEAGSA